MPQIVSSNLASLNAQRNLNKSQGALQTSLERLSSGLRINSAKDDAAGLAISNRFTTQTRGLSVAIRNANDGISYAQTTESALTEVTSALQRMRDLAVQSANDTNSASDRESLQSEINQLVSEINRIADTTTFNGKQVANGSAGELQFQIGANAGEQISIGSVDARASSLGSQPGSVQSTGNRIKVDDGEFATGTRGISAVNHVWQEVVIDNFNVAVGAEDAVNITAAQYGGAITAVNSGDMVDPTHAEYGNGVAKQIAARINSIRDSGVALENVYASAHTEFRGSEIQTDDINGSVDGSAPTHVGAGTLAHGDISLNGVAIGPVTFEEHDASGSLREAINAKSATTGVSASVDQNGELILSAADGRDILFDLKTASTDAERVDTMNTLFGGGAEQTVARFAGALTASDTTITLKVTGQVTVSASDTLSFGGNAGDLDELGFDSTGLAASGAEHNVQATGTIANADITTVAAASNTIAAIDSALGQVDAFRADLGAVQNRLESTIRNLSAVSESLSAANSRIRDADFAAETVSLSKQQVLQQAGISVLAQANGLPQQALSLLG